jgi:AraC-like DNA-binding protein
MIERDPKSDDSRYVRQGERLFKDFMKILATDKIKSRSVSAYAQRLFITPKYLSSVSKQLTGKTASVWINEAIVKEAKRQLKYTDKSVKEIAMQMDFPNVSFFGKYFKTHVGVSPMEYRRGK